MKNKLKHIFFELGFILFIVVFSMSFFSHGTGPNETPFTVLMYALIFIATLLIFAFDPREEKKISTHSVLFWFFILYSAWLLIEPYFSTWFDHSRVTTYVLFLTPLAFFVASIVTPTERQKKILLYAYLAFGLFLFSWAGLHFLATMERPDGPLLDANVFAGILLFFLLPVVAHWLIAERDSKVNSKIHDYLFLYIVIGCFAFITTQSRSATGALVIICLFVIIKLIREFKPIAKKRFLLLLLVNIVLVSLMPTDRMVKDITIDVSAQSRLMMWESGLEIYKDHKYSGVGLGMFSEYYPRYRNKNEISSGGRHVHSDYLEFLIDGGVIQLGFIIVLSLYIIFNFWKIFLSSFSKNNEKREMTLFLSLNIICLYFIQATVNFIFYIPVNAIIIGLLLGYYNRYALPNNMEVKFNLRHNLVLLLGSVLTGALMLLNLQASTFYTNNPSNNSEDQNVSMLNQANLLSILQPHSLALNHFKLKYKFLELTDKDFNLIPEKDFDYVNDEILKAGRNRVEDPHLLYALAKFVQENPDIYSQLVFKFPDQKLFLMNPAELYELAIDYDPRILNNYFALRELYKATDKRARAYFIMRDKLHQIPEYLGLDEQKRELVLTTLLLDAIELGFRSDAINYANEFLMVWPCHRLSLEVIGRDMPEGCG